MPHISRTDFIIGFIVVFVLFHILGWSILGKFGGAVLGLVVVVLALFMGIIPLYLGFISGFIVFTELGLSLIRGYPQENNSKTPQNPPEILDTFDKSQFKRKKP